MYLNGGTGLGTILGLWAHPDDEAYASAGLMAQAVAAGQRVVCVTATKGEAGFPDGDSRTLAERADLRGTELTACLAVLGVSEHRWLDHPDGGCAQVPDADGAAEIAAIIEEIRPHTILTFGPDGGTGHGDHVSMCRWTTLAVQNLRAAGRPVPRLLYSTKSREWSEQVAAGVDLSSIMMVPGLRPVSAEIADLAVWLHCDDMLLDLKVAALRAQTSQVEPMVGAMGLERYREFARDEFFREPAPGDVDILAQATAYSRGVR